MTCGGRWISLTYADREMGNMDVLIWLGHGWSGLSFDREF